MNSSALAQEINSQRMFAGSASRLFTLGHLGSGIANAGDGQAGIFGAK